MLSIIGKDGTEGIQAIKIVRINSVDAADFLDQRNQRLESFWKRRPIGQCDGMTTVNDQISALHK